MHSGIWKQLKPLFLSIFVVFWFVILREKLVSSQEETYYTLLGVSIDTSREEIKKAYRKLALELHPDKLLVLNITSEELEAAKEKFIKVIEAYETLIDDEKRLEYDYSLTGVEYKYVESDEESEIFKRKPFKIYSRSHDISLYFQASFPEKPIPDLYIDLKVDFKDSLKPIEKKKSFFKRSICPECKGIGGVPRPCMECSGSGISIRCKYDVDFESCISTTCSNCLGRGSELSSRCSRCSARGFIMEEDAIDVTLSVGTKHGFKVAIEKSGHEGKNGSRGNVIVVLNYVMPPGWRLDPETGTVLFSQIIDIESILRGYKRDLVVPTGEVVNMVLSDNLALADLFSGVQIIAHDLGAIIGNDGRRADLVVDVGVDWTGVSIVSIETLLSKYGFNSSDNFLQRALAVYAGLSPDNNNLEDDVTLS